ncbi:MAG: cytochrome c oxidase subunit 3, partial [Nitrososphaerota archaeon]
METPIEHDGAQLMYAGQTPVTEARKITVGIVMYIATDVLLAIMFFITYIWLRQYNTNNLWFPPGVKAPPISDLFWPAIVLAVSSGAYVAAQLAVRFNQQLLFRGSLLIALLIMFGVLVWEVYAMGHLPFTQTDGGFAVSYLLLLGYHIVHLAVAVLVGIGITVRGFRGYYDAARHVGVDVVGVWWHWVVLYSILFWLLVLMQPASLYAPS